MVVADTQRVPDKRNRSMKFDFMDAVERHPDYGAWKRD
jgi:hypothetical protein